MEMLVAGGKWVPVELRDGALWLTLGGEWEERPDGAPPECRLSVDPAATTLRPAEAPVRATRVLALSQFLEAQSAGVKEGDPVDVNLMRAHKEFAAELPRAIEDYQARLRDHSFDLFHAASLFGAARASGQPLDGPRAQLEESALKFEETSRWLAALQVMQSESE